MVASSTLFRAASLIGLMLSANATNLFDCDPDDFYFGFDPDSFGSPTALKQALHDMIDDHVIIPYGSTDEAMKILDKAPGSSEGVIGIYSLQRKHPFPDEWNREHVWPRSRGVGDSGADTSDLFHLHPTDMNLNSARGNKFYDECDPRSSGCESPAGTSSEDAAPGTSETSTTWAPPPSMRGDLARAVFYMATRYDGTDSSTTKLTIKECSTDSSCGSNSFGRLSTLLKWHREDPVSAQEMARNDGICNGYQGNRNPYIDFPELVERVYDPSFRMTESSEDSVPGWSRATMSLIVAAFVALIGVLEYKRRFVEPQSNNKEVVVEV